MRTRVVSAAFFGGMRFRGPADVTAVVLAAIAIDTLVATRPAVSTAHDAREP